MNKTDKQICAAMIILPLLLFAGMVAGCSDGVKVQPKDAQDIINKMQYAKDRFGVCYAVAASLNSDISSSYSIATVPCEKVGL